MRPIVCSTAALLRFSEFIQISDQFDQIYQLESYSTTTGWTRRVGRNILRRGSASSGQK